MVENVFWTELEELFLMHQSYRVVALKLPQRTSWLFSYIVVIFTFSQETISMSTVVKI